MNDLKELQSKLNYQFHDMGLLKNALTHKSFVNESRDGGFADNERLEFLGDAVLDLVISETLYAIYPQMSEGDLSKKRASLVREETLSAVAKGIELGKHMFLGKGEELSGGRGKCSILADAFEAVVAAIYLDGGMPEAEGAICKIFNPLIESAFHVSDFKSHLQEVCQKEKRGSIEYEVIDETGLDHEKKFQIELKIGGKVVSSGEGKNIKDAEQAAAKEALREIWGIE